MGAVHDIIGDGREIPAALFLPPLFPFLVSSLGAHCELLIFLLAGIFRECHYACREEGFTFKNHCFTFGYVCLISSRQEDALIFYSSTSQKAWVY